MDWTTIKHFRASEFDSPDEPGSGATHMQEEFVRKLDAVREAVGFPMPVVSGYRSPNHNLAVGGAPNSDHQSGMCADTSAMDKISRYKIVAAACAAGMRQIAVGDRIIHLGDDPGRATMFGIYHPGEPGKWY